MQKGADMLSATVRIKEKYQLTIPSAVRQKIDLQVGDSVEFVVESNGSLTLLPKAIIKRRQQAVRELEAIMRETKTPDEFKNMTEAEIMEMVIKEIKAVRAENRTKK